MSTHHTHNDLHSEQGALPGEHPGRAKNPVIMVRDLAWLEFEKPDLGGAEAFAHALAGTLCPNAELGAGTRLDDHTAGSFAVVARCRAALRPQPSGDAR